MESGLKSNISSVLSKSVSSKRDRSSLSHACEDKGSCICALAAQDFSSLQRSATFLGQ